MSMLNPLGRLARRDAPKPTLRERVAALKATAARVMRRRPADQPSLTSLPPSSAVDRGLSLFSAGPPPSEHLPQEIAGSSSREGAAAGVTPMEHVMGRHETFAPGTPIADDLLTSTILGHQPDPIFATIKAHKVARAAFEATVRPADELWVKERGGDTSTEAMAAASDARSRADAAETRAWNDLFIVPPTTQAGLVALIFHARQWIGEQDGNDLIPIEDVFSALARGVRTLPGVTAAGSGQGSDVSPALADLIGRHRAGLARLDDLPDSTDDETREAVDLGAWDLAHEAFTLPIAGLADLREKLKVAAPEIDEALDAAGHSMASHAWNCMRADLLQVAGAPVNSKEADPILALIRRHRDLLTAWDAEPDPADWTEVTARETEVLVELQALEAAMRTTVPTTAAGLRALIAWLRKNACRMGIKLGTEEGHPETDFVLDVVLNAAGRFQAEA